MRKAFVKALVELAEKDPRVVLLTADLGYNFLEPFVERFPDRFFNVGVAEQNLIGLATGLADEGYIPYVYSIATFAALRPYEFIRNGPVLQKLPVRIVGVGGGFEYDHAGPTHYALEDVGALRMQPGLHVIAPADHEQCRAAVLATHALPGPAYLRLGKDENYVAPGLAGRFDAGRAHLVRHGADALFIALGPTVSLALKAADELADQGLESAVLVVSSVSPAPEKDILDQITVHSFAITVEAHYTVGGLGSMVCEAAAGAGSSCRIVRCGVSRSPAGEQGDQAFMHRLHGFSPEQLAEAALAARRDLGLGTAASDWRAATGRKSAVT